MCTYFKTETNVAQNLVNDFFSNFHQRAEAATSSYSATGDFLQYIHSLLVTKNHQIICLVHEFSFTDVFERN